VDAASQMVASTKLIFKGGSDGPCCNLGGKSSRVKNISILFPIDGVAEGLLRPTVLTALVALKDTHALVFYY